MPFPINVSLTTTDTGSKYGPFVIGANLYAVYLDFISSNLAVYKSIDNGVTWNEMDAAGAPACSNNFVACSNGAILHIVFTAGLNLSVTSFDTGTDTWGAVTATLNVDASSILCAFYRAFDNSLIVLGHPTAGFEPAPGILRLGYFTFDLTTLLFSAWIPCGELALTTARWTAMSIVLGINEAVFIMMSFDGPTRKLYRQSLTDLGVLGAIFTISTMVDASNDSKFTQANSDGVNLAIVWQPSLLTTFNFEVLIAPLATMVFVPQALAVNAANTITDTGIVTSGGVTTVFVSSSTVLNGQMEYAIDNGGGFGALTFIGNGLINGNGGWGLTWPAIFGTDVIILFSEFSGESFWLLSGVLIFAIPWVLLAFPRTVLLPNPQTECCMSESRRCSTDLARKFQSKVVAYAFFGPKLT